jgi:hypothetical protein
VLTGSKVVRVAPPSLAAFEQLGIRPSTHPHGRQARRAPATVLAAGAHSDAAEPSGGAGAMGSGEGAEAAGGGTAAGGEAASAAGEAVAASALAVRGLATVLHAGDGIFIPAGWLHELEASASGAAAALSVTSHPFELSDFTAFVADVDAHLPFVRALYRDDFDPGPQRSHCRR